MTSLLPCMSRLTGRTKEKALRRRAPESNLGARLSIYV